MQLLFYQQLKEFPVHSGQMLMKAAFALEIDLLDLLMFGHYDEYYGVWMYGSIVDVVAGHCSGLSRTSTPTHNLKRRLVPQKLTLIFERFDAKDLLEELHRVQWYRR